jgi:hypothetical protein
LLSCATVLIAGALTKQVPASLPPTAPPPIFPVRADAAAMQALDQAVAAVDADRLGWVQARLWQKVHVPALPFQAEGTYQGGPGHRLRLDLQVRTADANSRLLIVSDGRTLWQSEEHAAGNSVSRVDLGKVLEVVETPEARAAFYRRQLGPAPLLLSLRRQVTFPRRDRVRWRGREVILLTGVWSKPPSDGTWADYFPRQCRLYLDARTLWLHRVEWWGPTSQRDGDSLVSELEFRDPAFGQAIPEQMFAFQPGKEKVTDWTANWVKAIEAE